MGIPALFLFQLQDANNNYYYVDANGNVQSSASEVSLKSSPKQWNQTKRKYGRSLRDWGVMRSSTLPFEFVEDGDKILRYIYYKDGLVNYDAYCKLTIKKRNNGAQNIWQYYTWFTTEIDFAHEPEMSEDENGASYTRVRLSDRALPEIIEDALTKEIDIPIDVNYHDIVLDGFPITGRYTWLTGDLSSSPTTISNGDEWVFPMGLTSDTSEYFSSVIYAQQQGSATGTFSPGGGQPTPPDAIRFLAVEEDTIMGTSISMDIDVTPDVAITGPIQFGLRLLRKNMTTDVNDYTTIYQQSINTGVTTPITFTYVNDLTYQAGIYSYFMVVTCEGGTGTGNVQYAINDYEMLLEFSKTLPETTTRAYRYDVYVEKAVTIATGGQTGVTSSFLSQNKLLSQLSSSYYYNSLPKNEFVTCGDAIRGISNPVIKTTLADVLKDLWSRWMVGSSTYSGYRLERIDYFFNPESVIGTINNIAAGSLKVTTATDLIYNKIKTGYDSGKADDKLNGKFDFAAMQYYKLPAKRIVREEDLTSPYIASPFEIERLRSNLKDRNTTSDQSDNRVFLLSAYNNAGAFNLIRNTGVLNGFLTDEIYNIAFRPHAAPLRHIPYLRSIMRIKDGVDNSEFVEFLSGERYTSFNTIIDGYLIYENGDIYAGSQNNGYHPQRLFHPIYFDFTCEPEDGFMTAIENNPYGVVRFYDDKHGWLEGFVMDVEVSPDETDVYTMKLLCSPNVDVKNLMN